MLKAMKNLFEEARIGEDKAGIIDTIIKYWRVIILDIRSNYKYNKESKGAISSVG